MAAPSIELNNGYKMPMIGLGTATENKELMGRSVDLAVECGYRSFDCAWLYKTENDVGKVLSEKIKQKKLKREDLFITGKLWNTFHEPEDVRPSLMESLKNLQTDYLDLYLMHMPIGYKNVHDGKPFPEDENGKHLYSDVDYVDTWRAMEALQKEGLVRSIGVSNFNEFQINRILKECGIPPAVNQIELHPYLTDHSLVDFCKEKGIAVTSFSSLGSSRSRPWATLEEPILLEDPKLKEIAAKLNKTVAQIVLRYLIQRGVVVIPRSVTPSRIEENFKIFDFELTNENMDAINGLNKDFRYMFPFDPDHKYYAFRENYTE